MLGYSIVVDDVDGDDTNSCNEPQDGDEVFDDNASDVSHGSKGSRGSISREESESRLQQIKVISPPKPLPLYPPYPHPPPTSSEKQRHLTMKCESPLNNQSPRRNQQINK